MQPSEATLNEFKVIAKAQGYNCFSADGESAYRSALPGSVSLNWCEKTRKWIALAYEWQKGSYTIAHILC